MATAKRKTTTKKSTKSTVPRKATARKKATTTKRNAGRSTSSSAKTTRVKKAQPQSFKLQRSQEPFVTTRVTIQTLYWLILAGAVLLLGLWVLTINQRVQAIYDEIDSNMMIQSELDAKELQLLREKQKQKQD